MRFILRGAAIGLLAGTLFFFVPFLFRFFLFFLVISFLIRLIWGGRRWRGRRAFGGGYHNPYFDRYGDQYNGNPISIDGRGFVPPVKEGGKESNFPVL
ncbi:MAG: hypothetical protein INR73_18475 [Williamsia sp.]|nr:hypothetical protein [Williamsia sp.]